MLLIRWVSTIFYAGGLERAKAIILTSATPNTGYAQPVRKSSKTQTPFIPSRCSGLQARLAHFFHHTNLSRLCETRLVASSFDPISFPSLKGNLRSINVPGLRPLGVPYTLNFWQLHIYFSFPYANRSFPPAVCELSYIVRARPLQHNDWDASAVI